MFELPKELFEVKLSNLKDIVIEPRLHNGWTVYYNFKKKMGYEQCIWVSVVIYNDNSVEFSYCTNTYDCDNKILAIRKIINTAVANYFELLGFKPIRN